MKAPLLKRVVIIFIRLHISESQNFLSSKQWGEKLMSAPLQTILSMFEKTAETVRKRWGIPRRMWNSLDEAIAEYKLVLSLELQVLSSLNIDPKLEQFPRSRILWTGPRISIPYLTRDVNIVVSNYLGSYIITDEDIFPGDYKYYYYMETGKICDEPCFPCLIPDFIRPHCLMCKESGPLFPTRYVLRRTIFCPSCYLFVRKEMKSHIPMACKGEWYYMEISKEEIHPDRLFIILDLDD